MSDLEVRFSERAVAFAVPAGDHGQGGNCGRGRLGGAVLIRPDRFVAWRSEQVPGAAEFERALRVIFDG